MLLQVHECASVLKQFLANLPQPILTEAYFRAHCQVKLVCTLQVVVTFLPRFPFL